MASTCLQDTPAQDKLAGLSSLASDKLQKLADALNAGGSDSLRAFLRVAARMHSYSANNLWLIFAQRENASMVAGFNRWKDLGRSVRKGEKGIAIVVPMVWRPKKDGQDDQCVQADQKGAKPEREDFTITRFKVGYVFDVSQTDGEPIGPAMLGITGDPGAAYGRLVAYCEGLGVTVEDSVTLPAGVHGEARDGTLVRLSCKLAPADRFAVLAHELGHVLLHQGANRARRTMAHPLRELEAESFAFVVSDALGLDAEASSSEYILAHRVTSEDLGDAMAAVIAAVAPVLEFLGVAA